MICTHCGATYERVEAENALLAKLAPTFAGETCAIPAPTLCPQCQMQRKLVWRNERGLHRRTCDKTGAGIISIYPTGTPFPVYKTEEWWGDDWDAADYGRDFDFTKTFAENYRDLLNTVPRMATHTSGNENCDFTNECRWSQNCYLVFGAGNSRNCLYCNYVFFTQDLVDCTLCANQNELLYDCLNCYGCYNTRHAQRSTQCSDCAFMLDCYSCKDCFGCVNLSQKQYCWFNEQLTKEEYEQRLATVDLGSRQAVTEWLEKFALHAVEHPRQALFVERVEDSLANNVEDVQRGHYCFDANNVQDCQHSWSCAEIKDCQQGFELGRSELVYDAYNIEAGTNVLFSGACENSSNILYSHFLHSCTDCFGCVGMKRGKHCVFNRQYSPEEYEELVAKIIRHMQETGEWGQFVPMHLSSFGYNETTAQQFFPLSREEIEAAELHWQEPNDPPQVPNAVAGNELPDSIADVTDDILEKTIRCPESGRLFKIQKAELAFYKEHGIPLPTLHPDIRHDHRWQRRQPYALWERGCMKCGTTTHTSISPETPETIYCKDCYNKHIR